MKPNTTDSRANLTFPSITEFQNAFILHDFHNFTLAFENDLEIIPVHKVEKYRLISNLMIITHSDAIEPSSFLELSDSDHLPHSVCTNDQ